jgi:putative ABC transport system ATP-binding protein
MKIKVENICRTFKGPDGVIQAVDDVSFELNSGDFFAVQGPSGCGKSTLLLMLCGLLSPDSGQIMLDDKNMYSMSSSERAGFRVKNIGIVFQQFYLIPYFSVLDNIRSSVLAEYVKNDIERAETLIKRFNLEHRKHHVPSALSIGEQQRTAMARALFHSPGILLADEPTGNLDPDNAQKVLEAFKEFTDDGGIVVMVTHEKDALAFAGRKLKMRNGKID